MNEIVHDIDDLFSTAYKNFREEPSPEVWDKLSVWLDKKDAIYHHFRFCVMKECNCYAYTVARLCCCIRIAHEQNN